MIKQSPSKRNIAQRRNWAKRRIMAMHATVNSLKWDNISLTLEERQQMLDIEVILNFILKQWKPRR